MATYWKSQPKKFCDFCKCWIAENKASVDFHERGKKHKENVEKRLDELRKNGLQRQKDEQTAKSSMAAIEEAAMKAFEKDVKNDPSMASQYGITAAHQFKQKQLQDQSKKEEEEKQRKAKEKEKEEEKVEREKRESNHGSWMEAMSEEGYTYYWNTVSLKTTWEKPENYISLQEQKDEDDTNEVAVENESGKGQKRKTSGDAYGQWQTVVVSKEEPVDLQLPESANYTTSQYKPQAEQHQEREKLEFKEKTVKSLQPDDTEGTVNIGFKKRKFNAGSRKIRKRDES